MIPHTVGRMAVFGDDLEARPDGVMAFSETTLLLWQASEPPARVGSALDLGCGAGALALLMARRAGWVTGTDLNLRAVELARRNARSNDVENVDFRFGDGFAPVRGERFDLIVSQPPYVAHPAGTPRSMTQQGGPRGDEIALRWLRQAADHLTPGGRAVFLLDMPVLETGFQPTVPGLWLAAPEISAADYAAEYPAFAGLREHYAALRIRAMRPCVAVVRATDKLAVIREVPAGGWRRITRDGIDEMIAATAS